MTDDLARRMADTQLAGALTDLARDAARFAESARLFADDVPTATTHGDTARRLTHDAANLMLLAARLDGMRHLDPLIPDKETP